MSFTQRLLRGVGMLVGAELLIKVFNLVFYMLLARRLGPSGMGRWTYAFAFVSLFMHCFNFGLAILFTREAAADPAGLQPLLDRFLPLRLIMAGLGLALLVPTAFLMRNLAPPGLILVFGLALALGLVGDLFRAVFRSQQRMEFEASLNILERALSAVLGVAALLLGCGVLGTSVAWTGGALATAAAAALLAGRAGLRWSPHLTGARAREILAQALPIFLLLIFSTIYFRQDVLFLRWFTDEHRVGLYGAAYRIFEMFVFLPGSLVLAYLPAATAAYHESREQFQALFRRTLALTFTLGCPLAVALWFRAREVVAMLFGADFAGSVGAVRVLVWTLPFFFANYLLSSTLIAGRRQKLPAAAVVLGTAVNAGFNLLLIPRMGILGAAWSTLLTEILLFGVKGIFVAQRLVPVNFLSPLARPLLAALGLGGVLWLARGLSLWPALLLGSGAYVMLGALLKLWSADEWRAIFLGRLKAELP